jgi:AraC-like DNA-binding protein/tetratricopeptide (TPR) repeat protein
MRADELEPHQGSSATARQMLYPRGVRRALAAMRSNVGREWSVRDLATIAGVSPRTLQRQFSVFVSKTPGATLRDIRFDHARRDLLRGLSGTKVGDVALHCGFTHLGRFSTDYRRRFGETPSQTLRRQDLFTGTLASMPSLSLSSRDRPTVAMAAIETGPENGELAHSISDELALALTRSGVAIVGQSGSPRYRVIGALHGKGRQTRLVLRMIEAQTGRHVSVYRADGPFGGNAASDQHLAARIAAAFQPFLRSAEINRAREKLDTDLSVHDLTLRAMPGVLSYSGDGNKHALELLQCAIDRDPDCALAIALASWAHAQRVICQFTDNPAEDLALSTELARRAQRSAPDATVLAVVGNALTLIHDLDTAGLVVGKALALDGGSAWAWSRSGWIDVYRGEAESGIEKLKISLDLAPQDPLAFITMVGIGNAHFDAGRYLNAAHWQEKALAENPSAIWVHRTLSPAYQFAGRKAEAQRSLRALRNQYPDLTISEVRQNLPPLTPDSSNKVVEALHTAGLPS